MASAGGNASDDSAASSISSYETDESGDVDARQWQGPPSTWRAFNAQEISNATALEQIRDRNLSLHLYNAFALKYRHRTHDTLMAAPDPEQDNDAETGRMVQTDSWVPPRSWTAWPLDTSRVPQADFLRRASRSDPVERFSLRMDVKETPSSAMQDAIVASVLRTAKDHFSSRAWVASMDSRDSPDVSERDYSPSNPKSVGMELDEPNVNTQRRIKSFASQKIDGLIPVVSANDDASQQILAPCARHIMSKLDDTLIALHNAQDAATSYLSDASDSDSGHSTRSRQRSASREPTIPRQRRMLLKPEVIKSFISQWDPDAPTLDAASHEQTKRGRPKKKYPRLPGESDSDYVLRVSRTRKLRIPMHMRLGSSPPSQENSAREAKASEAESKAPQQTRAHSFSERRRRQLQPRDWTDVLAAASLAGFSPQVINRVATRCADLFRQQTRTHTLEETRHDHDTWTSTRTFLAGMPMPRIVLEGLPGEDIDVEDALHQASVGPASGHADSEIDRASSRGRATSRGPSVSSRSRSDSAHAGRVFPCKVDECPRSREPFQRRSNMVRHMKQVHGMKVDIDVDSEDEMYGAVHVDGYMKPVRVRPGWRRETVTASSREIHEQRKRKRGRSRREKDDETS